MANGKIRLKCYHGFYVCFSVDSKVDPARFDATIEQFKIEKQVTLVIHDRIKQRPALLVFLQQRRHREYQLVLISTPQVVFPKLAIAHVRMSVRWLVKYEGFESFAKAFPKQVRHE